MRILIDEAERQALAERRQPRIDLIDLGLTGGVESFEIDSLHFETRITNDSIDGFDHVGLRQFDGRKRKLLRGLLNRPHLG